LEQLRIGADFGQNHARNLRTHPRRRKVKPRLAKRRGSLWAKKLKINDF